jgi:perosamine synthetase
MIKPRFMFYSMPRNLVLLLRYIFSREKKGIEGRITRKFESIFSIKNIILVPQCRVGIYLAVKAVTVDERDEFIVPAYTIYDVVNMILGGGGRPVFCDVKRGTANIDPVAIKKCITPKTRAVIVPHLHGLSADLSEIRAICDDNNLLLIEDVAQALGGNYGGKPLGTFGDISVFSFGRAKNINAFYGGAISIKEPGIRSSVESEISGWAMESPLKLWSRVIITSISYLATTPWLFNLVTFKYFQRAIIKKGENGLKLLATENNPVRRDVIPAAYLRKMTSLQGYLIVNQLDEVMENSIKRKAIADIYAREIHFSEDISVQTIGPEGSHEFFQFPIIVKSRFELGSYLIRNDVDIAFQHLNNLASAECFSEFAAECPEAEFLSKSIILLPTYPKFGPDDARKIVRTINNYAD